MAEEPLDVVMRMVDAWNRKDFDAMAASFDPDVEWHDRASFPDAGVYRGREVVAAHVREVAATVDLVWDVEEAVVGADVVMICSVLRGRGVGSGAGFEERVYAIGRVRDGLVTHRESFATRAEALAAAGLPDEAGS